MLNALPGVERVRAQASNQRIDVQYNETVLDGSAIAKRLGDAGYETKIGGPT